MYFGFQRSLTAHLFGMISASRWHLEPNYNGLSEEQVVNLGPQAHSMQHERVLATSSTLAARLARFRKAAKRQRGWVAHQFQGPQGVVGVTFNRFFMDPIFRSTPQGLTIIGCLGFQPSNWGLWHWVYHRKIVLSLLRLRWILVVETIRMV